MTKKDYKKIASALHSVMPEDSQDYEQGYLFSGWLSAVEAMADVLAKDNEKFNNDKFYRACIDGTEDKKSSAS